MSSPSPLAWMAAKAMEAGLAHQRMPDFGPRLKPEWLEVINYVYDAARNRGAGERYRARRVK